MAARARLKALELGGGDCVGITHYDIRMPVQWFVHLVEADGTAKKNFFFPAASQAIRLDDIMVTTNAAADHVLSLIATIGSTDYQVGSATVPLGSGYGGVAPFNLLAFLGPIAAPGLAFGAASSWYCKLAVTLGSGEVMDVMAYGGVL